MPGFITHYICGQAVLKDIEPDIQKMIRPYQQFYNIGTQGPDIFFYYLPGFLKKRIRNVGIEMHKSNFSAFISSLIDAMSQEKGDSKAILTAYISGFLTHYSLDAIAHPYVYSKTGVRQKGDTTKAIKYSVNHRKFETAIDVLMLNLLSSKKPSDYKLWELIQVNQSQARVVAQAMSESLKNAYGRDACPKDVCKAMAYMVNITRIIQSNKGRRKRLMELIENLTIGDHLFSSIVHMQEVGDGVDYMNLAKSPWNVPGTKAKTASFVELYNEAVSESTTMINNLWRYMNGEISRSKLLINLGDRSLSTGFAPDPSILLG